MKKFKKLTYAEKIKWRIRLLWLVILLMLVYMVVIVELGGGDSRIMTDLAHNVSRLIFFGGLAVIGGRIYYNKKILKNRLLLKEQRQKEQDERNQYLHDKSGGLVLDILLVCMLFITNTTALFNMAAFHTAAAILGITLLLKLGAYLGYRHWS